MVCLSFEPTAAGWWAQTIPRSYGGRLTLNFFSDINSWNSLSTRKISFNEKAETLWFQFTWEMQLGWWESDMKSRRNIKLKHRNRRKSSRPDSMNACYSIKL